VYKRPIYDILNQRLAESRRFIQVLSGPRQTGKTTIAQQVLSGAKMPGHYASADEPALKDRSWIEQQWEAARIKTRMKGRSGSAFLVLDEIQKITGWSETVKRLWDEDASGGCSLHVVLLGSSALLVQSGLTESLAGRFEVIPVSHWSFAEMKQAFGWSLDDYILHGGYPGAAGLIDDFNRYAGYIRESLIETTISRDILLMRRVDKPALLRQLFLLACSYSGQVLSYQKMLGQLQEAGNTTTLAHYLDLLQGAGLVCGLQKYAGQRSRQRASSPKLLVLNTALMTAVNAVDKKAAMARPDYWGRLVESAVGSSLANSIRGKNLDLFYWSGRNREVDFLLCRGSEVVAIEVKSGRRRDTLPGMEAFSKEFKVRRKLLIGPRGIPFEDFLLAPAESWFD
jgi:uncharacterized protein